MNWITVTIGYSTSESLNFWNSKNFNILFQFSDRRSREQTSKLFARTPNQRQFFIPGARTLRHPVMSDIGSAMDAPFFWDGWRPFVPGMAWR
jgi:hypothetical protein